MISRVSRQFDVKFGPTDVFGAALLSPGFCEDLTTWRLTIDESGLITQEILLHCDPLYLSEKLTRTSQLTQEQLQRLRQLANDLKFDRLKEEYDPQTDDAETTTIVLMTPDGPKSVYATDAFHVAEHENDAEMERYVRLWDAIMEYAPTSTAAWRQDREAAERKMYITQLKLRVKEKDCVLPTLDNLVGALLCPLAIVLLLQLCSWNFSQGMRDFPDYPQLILWSGIIYSVLILFFVHHVFQRRRERLAAVQQMSQYQADHSVMNDEQPNTEH